MGEKQNMRERTKRGMIIKQNIRRERENWLTFKINSSILMNQTCI